ncbi:MAG: OmpA family protein [Geminicoccaceae bacterium]
MLKTTTRRRLTHCLLAAVLSVGTMVLSGTRAEAADPLDIAIGSGSGPTYNLGIGISSLVKVKLLPSEDIDLDPVITNDDRESLIALNDGTVAFALVAVDDPRPFVDDNIQALATLGNVDGRSKTLLVRRDVDDQTVQSILQSVFNGIDFLAAIDPALSNLHPDEAVIGLTLPLHRGAKRFYATWWSSPEDEKTVIPANAPAADAAARPAETAQAPEPPSGLLPADARNFIFYFGFDDDKLSNDARETLREAADFAGTLRSPAVFVAAYTDSVGNAEYNYLLAERRAGTVVQGLDQLGVVYSRMDLSLFGERSPWEVTLDDVNEANNRRVELFIEEPVPEMQPLPISSEGVAESPAPVGSEAVLPRRTLEQDVEKPAGGPVEKIPPTKSSTRPLM